MSPECAKELFEVIMQDDYVARRDALNNWGRRWVATLMVEHPQGKKQVEVLDLIFPGRADEYAKAALVDMMVRAVVQDTVDATRLTYEDHGKVRLAKLELAVLLQKPKEIT